MMAFGEWLIDQRLRHDWIGQLADQAARDPRFPKHGSAEDARRHLSRLQVEPDLFEMLDDAEAEWERAA